MTLTFSPPRATIITHTRAKYQGQRLVSSKARVKTDEWTDTNGQDRLQWEAVSRAPSIEHASVERR